MDRLLKLGFSLVFIFISNFAYSYDNFVIFSTGDYVACFGNGTDPAFDSPEGIDCLAKTWKDRGITGVIHRFDTPDAGEEFIFTNPVGNDNPEHRFLTKSIEEIAERFSQPLVVRAAAEKYGLEYWAWWPTVYSDGCPSDIPYEEHGLDKTSWNYEHRYVRDHPEVLTIDRKGKKQYGVMEYAYPGARKAKVAEFVHFANKFGVRNFIACLRSEASQMQLPPVDADQFGFNQPVVDEMKKLYGVDILTDARFDFKDPNFKRTDPMLENWRKLRGSYLTQFYRELRQALITIDPKIKIAVQLPGGDYLGSPLGNMHADWRTWIDEGLIDLIIYGITLEASLDPQAPSKGYFTDAIADKGLLPASVFREFIDQSKNPKARLFQANGDYYFFREPDGGFDGWRTDFFCAGFTRAWYQRWSQWKQDIKDFGYIKYIENDFDGMPVKSECYYGGYGDPRYNPLERKGSGIWSWLGNGDNLKPYAQNEIKHGDKGNAIKLTSGNDSGRMLKARMWGGTNRVNMYIWANQNQIANGSAELSFWLYRPDVNSGVAIWLESDKSYIRPVNLTVAAGGEISYSADGKNVSSGQTAKVGQWQKFVIDVDVETKRYSVSVDGAAVGKDIAYPATAESFCLMYFDPGNAPNTPIYLDEVSLRWKPQLYDVAGKNTVLFSDDCESYVSKSKLKDNSKSEWAVQSEDNESDFVIENSMSFGDGVRCIRALGGSLFSKPWTFNPDSTVVLDIDVFLKSDLPYISMATPAEGWKSKSGTVIGLVNAKNEAIVEINAVPAGNWSIWDGQKFVDCGAQVQYDAWNHIRMIVDTKTNECSYVVQPIGDLPSKIGRVSMNTEKVLSGSYRLKISPTENSGHKSCYDNIRIMEYKNN